MLRPSSEVLTRRSTCRGCGGANLALFLSLGETPLANSFLSREELKRLEKDPERRFPLEVYFCRDCSLVQLLHIVNPEVLFAHYLYRTGTNQTIERHNAALAEAAVRKAGLNASSLVVEIASNDGSLLQCFRGQGMRTLGVEPAKNIASTARAAGIETIGEFFDQNLAARIVQKYGPAHTVVANNVLAHVDATVEFLSSCRHLLAKDGSLIIEVPYLAEMLTRLEYDTIYHEHLCYFSVSALMRMFAGAGLALAHIDQVEIHGGSLRLWARQGDTAGHAPEVEAMAAGETVRGLTRLATYEAFSRRVERNRENLLKLLRGLCAEGKSVAGYGAPAKGNTLLCYCGIGTELVPFTVDRSPLKIGLYTPGTHIPVEPVERIFADQPDYVLILAWNFAPEIMEFLRPYKARGGRFILPIPEPTIL